MLLLEFAIISAALLRDAAR